MTTLRARLLPLAALPLLLSLAACDPGSIGSGSTPPPDASEAPTDAPSGSPAPDASPATIVVTGSGISLLGADGSTLFREDFAIDGGIVAGELADALGVEPTVTTTVANGACEFDQTIYDFGGIVLMKPGYADTRGAYEALVTGTATTGGVAITTLGGAQIGASSDELNAAVGGATNLFGDSNTRYVGFDQANVGAPDREAYGVFATLTADHLTRLDSPWAWHTSC
ncbi:MAG: hypothetical protein ABI435_06255 [Pseudolysinimonas sp.]